MKKIPSFLLLILLLLLTGCSLFRPTVVFETYGGSPVESVKTKNIENQPSTEKENYMFKGWYLDDAFVERAVFPLRVKTDMTLYAKWVPLYTVFVETNGGTNISPYVIQEKELISKEPQTFREGYTLEGWYFDDAFTKKASFPLQIKSDTILYAKWIKLYTVSFEMNGGPEKRSFRDVDGATLVGELAPKRDGYDFVGWYLDEAFTKKASFPHVLTSDTTFYAKWRRLYTMSFETNGGSEVYPFNIEAETVLSKIPKTEREGYVFEGWYADKALTQEIVLPLKVKKDMMLYAKWTKLYTVRFQENGGTFVDSQKTQIIEWAPYTEREGYLFAGWYYNEGLTKEVVYPIRVASDITLYAKWLLLEKEVACTYKELKAMDDEYSDNAYYSLAPREFDFQILEQQGYWIKIKVQYSVWYEKDFFAPFDIGYFGAPKYDAAIINSNNIGVWKTNLVVAEFGETRTIEKAMTVAEFNKNNMYLYFATENVQNIVCFDDIKITFSCYK
ncbi:MAG: InlB B-repeat-containing protein [Clostridia bacterium]|nr:InlB B-repeat-containing protein [Clostridia bacterium]